MKNLENLNKNFLLSVFFGLVPATIVGPGVRSVGQVKPLLEDDITLAA